MKLCNAVGPFICGLLTQGWGYRRVIFCRDTCGGDTHNRSGEAKIG